MSLLLNDIQLPLLVKAAIVDHNTLSWNNLDQLSSLWTVFSKYKSNIRDGFRLENLSWRLWYRQSILQKKESPKTSQDINYSSVNQTRTLRRTRSLPNLSQWKSNVTSSSSPTLKKQESIKLVPSKQSLSSLLPQQRKKQKFFISTDESQKRPEDQQLFKKTHNIQPKSSLTMATKPVSLLSEMLNGNQKTCSGLRRCQSRYGRLDQFFLNAA
ncbi:hypothetical protein BD560DRAFT_395086 [Blakeslea trispora]|nr:hypothetical protein BD560DRAFT_395086 [Blakeslea trispora]